MMVYVVSMTVLYKSYRECCRAHRLSGTVVTDNQSQRCVKQHRLLTSRAEGADARGLLAVSSVESGLI